MPQVIHSVRPRYTPGSPAWVDSETFSRVVREERSAYEVALEGVWGEAERARALRLGLSGIAEAMIEKRGRWAVHDELTDERFERPFRYRVGDDIYVLLIPDSNAKGCVIGKVFNDVGDDEVTVLIGESEIIRVRRCRTRDPRTIRGPARKM